MKTITKITIANNNNTNVTSGIITNSTVKSVTKLAYDDFCSGCGRPHEDCNC